MCLEFFMTEIILPGKKTKQKGKSKQEVEDPEFRSLPVQPSANEKEYEPKDFESTHITDVVQENEELKMKVYIIKAKSEAILKHFLYVLVKE